MLESDTKIKIGLLIALLLVFGYLGIFFTLNESFNEKADIVGQAISQFIASDSYEPFTLLSTLERERANSKIDMLFLGEDLILDKSSSQSDVSLNPNVETLKTFMASDSLDVRSASTTDLSSQVQSQVSNPLTGRAFSFVNLVVEAFSDSIVGRAFNVNTNPLGDNPLGINTDVFIIPSKVNRGEETTFEYYMSAEVYNEIVENHGPNANFRILIYDGVGAFSLYNPNDYDGYTQEKSINDLSYNSEIDAYKFYEYTNSYEYGQNRLKAQLLVELGDVYSSGDVIVGFNLPIDATSVEDKYISNELTLLAQENLGTEIDSYWLLIEGDTLNYFRTLFSYADESYSGSKAVLELVDLTNNRVLYEEEYLNPTHLSSANEVELGMYPSLIIPDGHEVVARYTHIFYTYSRPTPNVHNTIEEIIFEPSEILIVGDEPPRSSSPTVDDTSDITNQNPVAICKFEPREVALGQEVQLISTSYDRADSRGPREIESVYWDFDNDGKYSDTDLDDFQQILTSGITSEGGSMIISELGTFTVGIKVFDADGASDTDTCSVTVTSAPSFNVINYDEELSRPLDEPPVYTFCRGTNSGQAIARTRLSSGINTEEGKYYWDYGELSEDSSSGWTIEPTYSDRSNLYEGNSFIFPTDNIGLFWFRVSSISLTETRTNTATFKVVDCGDIVDDLTCDDSSDCEEGYWCSVGVCIEDHREPECTMDIHCGEGRVCEVVEGYRVCVDDTSDGPLDCTPRDEISDEVSTDLTICEGDTSGTTPTVTIVDEVTFDCNDMILRGVDASHVAIKVNAPGKDVTIKNCDVRRYGIGVEIIDAHSVTLIDNKFSNPFPQSITWKGSPRIFRANQNDVDAQGTSIELLSIETIELTKNKLKGNQIKLNGRDLLSAYNLYNIKLDLSINGLFIDDGMTKNINLNSYANTFIDVDYDRSLLSNLGNDFRSYYTTSFIIPNYEGDENNLVISLSNTGDKVFNMPWANLDKTDVILDSDRRGFLALRERSIKDELIIYNNYQVNVLQHSEQIVNEPFNFDPLDAYGNSAFGILYTKDVLSECITPKMGNLYFDNKLFLDGVKGTSPLDKDWFYTIYSDNVNICEGKHIIMSDDPDYVHPDSYIIMENPGKLHCEIGSAINPRFTEGYVLLSTTNGNLIIENCQIEAENGIIQLGSDETEIINSKINVETISIHNPSRAQSVRLYNTITHNSNFVLNNINDRVFVNWPISVLVLNNGLPVENNNVELSTILKQLSLFTDQNAVTSSDGETEKINVLGQVLRKTTTGNYRMLDAQSTASTTLGLSSQKTSREFVATEPRRILLQFGSPQYECLENIDCEGNLLCIDNECIEGTGTDDVECSDDSDCDSGVCVSNECVECRSNSECSGDDVCVDNECIVPECADDDDCDGSTPECNEDTFECVECTSDSHCDSDEECNDFKCEEKDSSGGSGGRSSGGSSRGGSSGSDTCVPASLNECLALAKATTCKTYVTGNHRIPQCEVTEECDAPNDMAYVRYSCTPERTSFAVLSSLPTEIKTSSGRTNVGSTSNTGSTNNNNNNGDDYDEPDYVPPPSDDNDKSSIWSWLWWLLLLIIILVAIILIIAYEKRKGSYYKPNEQETTQVAEVGTSTNVAAVSKELNQFIDYYRKRGFTDTEIATSLRQAGWKEEIIEKFLKV